jgi:hypothetical protein
MCIYVYPDCVTLLAICPWFVMYMNPSFLRSSFRGDQVLLLNFFYQSPGRLAENALKTFHILAILTIPFPFPFPGFISQTAIGGITGTQLP